jgi:hypothetical protein
MTRPRISDHALVRFLERAGGLDVEDLRGRLESSLERAHTAARSISEADYLIKADGLTYVVRGELVSTVLEDRTAVASAATLAQRRV